MSTSVAHIVRRRRRRQQRKQESRARSRAWMWILIVTVGLLILGPVSVISGGVVSAYGRALSILPNPRETIELDPIIGPTEIYDSSGTTLLFSVEDSMGNERQWLELDNIPNYVIQATLQTEDPDFLTATHFNLFQVTARLWENLLHGPLEADSSITGRLVRNVIAPSPAAPGVDDRALEIALVSEINRLYSPEEVLEWHLNTNYYGNQAYGIEAAAQIYLGKSVRDLTLDEAAMLAAIATAPQYNPVDNETAARSRQYDLLRRLLAAGQITQNQFELAANVTTAIRPDAGQTPLVAPDFALYARRQAETILDQLGHNGPEEVARGGLRITTTLDLDLYYQSECVLRAHLERLATGTVSDIQTLVGDSCVALQFLPAISSTAGDTPPDSGTIIVLDAATGEIKAMVGPGARTAYQPGPVLYPFVYLDGLRGGDYTPATMLQDIPLQFRGAQDGLLYLPRSLDERFFGPMSLRQAMGSGRLPPAVEVANTRGLNSVLRETANPLGINSLTEGVYDLSLLEHGGLVSPLDVAYAYSIFAALGDANGLIVQPLQPNLRNHDPVAVQRIEDANGNVIWEYNADQIARSRVDNYLVDGLAYLVNNILSDSSTRWDLLGANNALDLTRPAGVVNGMTSDRVDDWTVGYTTQLVTTVHLGLAQGGAMSLSPSGIEGAAPVWRAVMDYAHVRDGLPVEDWPRPAMIVDWQVCEMSGMLPNGVCPVRTEIFADGTQPRQPDTFWQSVSINTQSRLRATPATDPALLSTELFFVPSEDSDLMDWWSANRMSLPPEDYDTASRPDPFESAVILTPESFAYVGGQVDVRGSMDTFDLQFYQLAYGQGLNPTEWIDITGQQTTFAPGSSLATWDTAGLDEGVYWLLLTVVLNDNTRESAQTQVTVDNIPPSVVLMAGEPGQIYRWPTDQVLRVQALVQDNIKIERVEFYHNGLLLGARDDCNILPDECVIEWEINRTGVEVFQAVVYDAVGNNSSAEISVEVIRDG